VHLAKRISVWRRARGLSQGDVARLVGITPEAVSQWESGKVTPTYKNIERFVDVLGLTMERFHGVLPKRRFT